MSFKHPTVGSKVNVQKKPIVIGFRFAEVEEVIQTLEGPVTARPGDAVITGVKGEQYPIQRFKFDDIYVVVESGKAYKRAIVVEAERMAEPFEVNVSWAKEPIKGKAGDYRLTYGPGDFGAVDVEIFAETYDIV